MGRCFSGCTHLKWPQWPQLQLVSEPNRCTLSLWLLCKPWQGARFCVPVLHTALVFADFATRCRAHFNMFSGCLHRLAGYACSSFVLLAYSRMMRGLAD